ncbi:SDR family NAD(P)-dependent oxidoreductase [Evansella tamaricis]|uniref:SDR family oxidoreductase n=1 Tax=Evansella tamaricis TaxID=2069301 RepID=A0ABS6JM39_9BACI|nr:SDR family oxidoreductase [Evansella tamaricis]MBU9714733.1 SDR family oxidoreductase [Evansella tamaricis]
MWTWDGKHIVITGASSGIGEWIAREVAGRGGTPIMLARSYEKLSQTATEIERDTGIVPIVFALDITDAEQVERIFQKIHTIGEIHGLINNAGFAIFEYVQDASLDQIKSMFDVNVFGAVACTKEVLPSMHRNGTGHIVFIASQAGKLATPKSSGYSATKHAILGFANSLRLELAGSGIHVSSVNPGPVRTPFFDLADQSGEYQKNVERYMLDAEDVARKTVNLFEKPKRELNLPGWMSMGTKLYQLFPGLVEAVAGKQFRKK